MENNKLQIRTKDYLGAQGVKGQEYVVRIYKSLLYMVAVYAVYNLTIRL